MAVHLLLMALVFGSPSLQGEVRGIVQDEWGKPVPHARVYLPASAYDYDFAPPEWLSTTTDARGRFVFRGVSPQRVGYGAFAIHPEAGWTVDVATQDVAAMETQQPQRLTLTITLARPTEPLTGRVVNPEGDPIPGATVRISRVNSLFIPGDLPSTTTNKNGRFQLNIPPDSQVTLTVSEDSYATQSFEIEPGANPMIVLPRAGYITATFIDENSGEPAGNVPVEVVSADQETYGPILKETSDASGKIRLKVPSETELLLYSEDLAKGAYVPINIEPLKPGETRDLGTVLVRRRPNLSVTLHPPQGVEIQKWFVSIRSNHPFGEGTKTLYYNSFEGGKESKAEIPLADGKYVIYAWSYVQDRKYYESPRQKVTITQGKSSTEGPLVLSLQEPKREEFIRAETTRTSPSLITIFRPDGKHPRRVWIGRGDEWGPSRATLTPQGKVMLHPYSIERTRQLVILDPDTLSGIAQPLEDPPKAFSVQLQPLPKKRIVVTTEEGQPIFRAHLYLHVYYLTEDFGRTWLIAARPPLNLTTDSKGSAEVPYIPGVSCWVIAYRPGYELVGTRLDKAPGNEITLTLPRATSSYTGIVINEQGMPMRGIILSAYPQVNWVNEEPPYSWSALRLLPTYKTSTDAQGRFAFYAIPKKLLQINSRHFYYEQLENVEPEMPLLVRVTKRTEWELSEIEEEPGTETTRTVRRVLSAPTLTHHLKTNIRWLNGEPEWDRAPTLVLFTAPHLSENAEWVRAFSKAGIPHGKFAMVLDTPRAEEAREYSKEIGFTGNIGIWEPQGYAPKSLAGIAISALPYPVLLNSKGEIVSQGFRKEELAEILRTLQPKEEQP